MKTARAGTLALAALAWGLLAPTDALALQCAAGTFEFYPGGGIKSCLIEANHQFWTHRDERIVCAGKALMTQHENGAVARCTIPEPLEFGGTRCTAGSVVELSPDGGLKTCGKGTP